MAVKLGDRIALRFDEPSAIGYNGIICDVIMSREKNGETFYFCESVYGSATCWAREENMVPQG